MNKENFASNPFASGRVNQVTFTIGVEDANVIAVSAQLKDGISNIITPAVLPMYLSDSATGADVVATAPSAGVTATTGALATVVANKFFHAISNAAGVVAADIEHNGAKTCYLVAVLPDGNLAVSSAIAFT